MKFILKIDIPMEAGNRALKDPKFGETMQGLLSEIGAEAAYFTAIDGRRGALIVVDINDSSEIPSKAEPFFLWLGATVEPLAVMTPEDLAKAGPAIGAAVQKWGS